MKTSTKCKEAIKLFENCETTAYKCPAGVYTIGFGHTKNVKAGMRITKDKALELLEQDLAPIERYLNTIPEINTQGRFDACVDFCFNVGIGAFQASTLLKYIKDNKNDEMILAQFNRWVYAGGKPLKGLIKRRAWEMKRWKE